MCKTMIGLGVLSVPSAFDVLGIIPEVICLLAIATITIWSTYIVGVFKLNHREVYAIDDVGFKLFGVIGREVFGTAFCICKYLCSVPDKMQTSIANATTLDWIFVSGSGMLSISIALNTISAHGTCTAVFVAVAAICVFILSSIRTLGKMAWVAQVGLVSIMAGSRSIKLNLPSSC